MVTGGKVVSWPRVWRTEISLTIMTVTPSIWTSINPPEQEILQRDDDSRGACGGGQQGERLPAQAECGHSQPTQEGALSCHSPGVGGGPAGPQ